MAQAPAWDNTPRTRLFPASVWALAAVFALVSAWSSARTGQPDDLAAWWIGARLVAEGQANSLYAVDPVDFSSHTGPQWAQQAQLVAELAPFAHPYVHIPLLAYVLAPLSAVTTFESFAAAVALINGASMTLLVAAAISLWTRRPAPAHLVVIGTSLVWVSTAGKSALFLGQSTPMILAAIAMALALSRTRPVVAGVLLAGATLIKVTPVVLVAGMLLFASRRRAGLVAAILSVAGLVLSTLLAGVSVTKEWIATVRAMGSKSLVGPMNSSLDSLFGKRTDPLLPIQTMDGSSSAALAVKIAIVVVVLVLLFVLCGTRSDHIFEIASVTVLLTAMALSGVVWVHYGIVATLAITGVLLLHRNWLGAFALLFAFAPLGEIYDSAETTPAALPWATLALILVPMLALILGEVYAHRPVSIRSIRAGVLRELRPTTRRPDTHFAT